MKKIIILLTILLLCGCVPKLKFKDTKEYIYTNYEKEKITKFVVKTVTLLGQHCYDINKEDGLKVLDRLEIKKETKMYATDSDMYYIISFQDGATKSFKFNAGNLVYNGKRYELNENNSFELTRENEIDCSTEKINHNLIKTNIFDKYNLYYYEIDNAYINISNEEVDLKDALLNNTIDIDNLVSKLNKKDLYYDGGTILYKNNKVFKEDLELIKCKTLEGNIDVYVGKSGMGYRNNFCKNDNHTFTRTYTINKVSDYNEEQGVSGTYAKSLKVSLKGYDNKDVEVIINNFWDKLEVNKTYEFEFMPYDSLLDDDVVNIFKNSFIVGVKETTKTELDQINDLIR